METEEQRYAREDAEDRGHGRVASAGPDEALGPRFGAGEDGAAIEPAVEIVGEFRGASVASARFPGEALEAEGVEQAGIPGGKVTVGRGRGVHPGWRDGGFLRGPAQGLQRGCGGKRGLAAQQFVQDGTQAVDIAGDRGLGRPAPGHFRRQVVGGAENGEGMGEAAVLVGQPGQPEIGHVRLANGVEEDVGRLEIAVEDAVLVGKMDRTGDLRDQGRHRPQPFRRAGGRKRGHPGRQGSSLQQLHGDEVPPLVLPGLMDRDDVGVVEPGNRSGLGVEALDLFRTDQASALDQFQRHVARQSRLAGPVDDPHAAPGDLPDQLVAAHVGGRGVEVGGGSPHRQVEEAGRTVAMQLGGGQAAAAGRAAGCVGMRHRNFLTRNGSKVTPTFAIQPRRTSRRCRSSRSTVAGSSSTVRPISARTSSP